MGGERGEQLHDQTVRPIAVEATKGAWYLDWRVVSLDGSTLDVADEDANNEAFRDHWGFTPPTEADYNAWLNNKVIFTPEMWKIAWDVEKNEVAGQVKGFINHEENKEFKRLRGYCEFISTRRPYRKQGVARALIALTLREFKARGMTEAALGVDAQNPNGAVRVYEACGFRVAKRFTTYRKPLEQFATRNP